MSLFKQPPVLSPRAALERQYANSRANLMLLIAFTVINLVLLLANSDWYFLFSAYIPYYAVVMGMFYCGKFPPEYYEDMADMIYTDDSFLIVTVAFAVFVTLLYLLAWLCSKNHKVGWLIFALVLFGIDTFAMLLIGGFDLGMLIEIFFHVWVIVILILGITSHYKLKKMPIEEPIPAEAADLADAPAEELPEA